MPEENLNQKLRKLVFEDECDLDDAFKQAEREHRNLSDQANELLRIKQQVDLDLKDLKRKHKS